MPSRAAARERYSFASLEEILEMPDLLAVQKDSFEWFMRHGLQDVFSDISPIKTTDGSLQLELEFDPDDRELTPGPKFTETECRIKHHTYAVSRFVKARFSNRDTGEIKEQVVYIGEFPKMTERGTFLVNGIEKVIVSQLVRSPGVIFEAGERYRLRNLAKHQLVKGTIHPQRGEWLEFDVEHKPGKNPTAGARIARKRRLSIFLILRALGYDEQNAPGFLERFVKYFDFLEEQWLREKHVAPTRDEAMIEIMRRTRPSEPATVDTARINFEGAFFESRRYDTSRVGRYKLNRKIGAEVRKLAETFGLQVGNELGQIDIPTESQTVLARSEVLATITYLLHLVKQEPGYRLDDQDHFANRRVRPVGELIQNQVRIGLSRMERVVRERMSSQDQDGISPLTLINVRPLVGAIKEFFNSSQLSQFMDQTNALSGLTHRRRLSALGPGGLSRERAGFEVRDVHFSHYGRMCPIETPEGPNIGLQGALATYGQINPFGFIETPYRRVKNGRVTNEVRYMAADEEEEYVIAEANTALNKDGSFVDEKVLVRRSPQAATLEDLKKMLEAESFFGSTTDLALVTPQARDGADLVLAKDDGVVETVTGVNIVVRYENLPKKDHEHVLVKFRRSNQDTTINQLPRVREGQKVKKGDLLADGPSTDQGELALGKNLLVALMPWEGYNYEDAIIISERLVKEDVLTSIHVKEHEVDSRDTKLGPEEITRDIPNLSEDIVADLDDRGIIRVGADVAPGDVLVGKVSPKGETELTPEERLLRAIFGEKAREVRNTSLNVPHGETGKVINIEVLQRVKQDGSDGDELPPGVNELVRVYVAQKRKISVGDKLAGRHGNKGVISKILPIEDMPYLDDGTPVDIILNPLGVPSRMNIGQVLEAHLGYGARWGWVDPKTGKAVGDAPLRGTETKTRPVTKPSVYVATPVFDGAHWDETSATYDHPTIQDVLGSINPESIDGTRLVGKDGKVRLRNGRTGEYYDSSITVGYMYILKLHHLVDDKIHARSTGPYSMITQQPLGGKAQFGGQRFGEMEVWALEAYGAAYCLQEILTLKSDDVFGRVHVYESIVKGSNLPEPGVPESFKVLMKEMKALCLDVEVLREDGRPVELADLDDDIYKTQKELGINLTRPERGSDADDRLRQNTF